MLAKLTLCHTSKAAGSKATNRLYMFRRLFLCKICCNQKFWVVAGCCQVRCSECFLMNCQVVAWSVSVRCKGIAMQLLRCWIVFLVHFYAFASVQSILGGYQSTAVQLLGCLDFLIGNCSAGSKMFQLFFCILFHFFNSISLSLIV